MGSQGRRKSNVSSDIFSKRKRSEIMSLVRSADTKPERVVRSFLSSEGYRYRLHSPNLPGRPDIVLRKYRTVIFVNGCFWHQHRGCKKASVPIQNRDFWMAKLVRNKERDKQVTSKLRRIGWSVLTLWECQVKKGPDILRQKTQALRLKAIKSEKTR